MERAQIQQSVIDQFRFLPPLHWLAGYQAKWIASDCIAGITLAAYAIPVSLAYAALAGLPPQAGVYGYLLGGLGYAVLGSSRQLAVGPTSAISLMISATVGAMAEGSVERYIEIAALAAFTVAALCFIAWLLRLSVIVRLISDSILVGFKAGAGLTIIMTQLPALFGLPGGGHNFLERTGLFVGQIGQTNLLVLVVGAIAMIALLIGERTLPGRPVALCIVALAIIIATLLDLSARGVPTTGLVPRGLPSLSWSELRWRDVDGIFPLAAGCLLLAYVEGVSAARTFAAKHGYSLDPRQEFLGIGAANLAVALGHGYPVAGGLSQSAVNDKAGARTPLALIFASLTLAICLLFFTGLLANLPKAVLAAVVVTAVLGLIDLPTLARMWRISKIDFSTALIALGAVLLLGILQGILLAALASILILLGRASQPTRRVSGTNPRHKQLFRSCPPPRQRAVVSRGGISARSLIALHQCRVRGSGRRQSPRRCRTVDPRGHLRSVCFAIRRYLRIANVASTARHTFGPRHCAPYCGSARPFSRSSPSRRCWRESRRVGSPCDPRRYDQKCRRIAAQRGSMPSAFKFLSFRAVAMAIAFAAIGNCTTVLAQSAQVHIVLAKSGRIFSSHGSGNLFSIRAGNACA